MLTHSKHEHLFFFKQMQFSVFRSSLCWYGTLCVSRFFGVHAPSYAQSSSDTACFLASYHGLQPPYSHRVPAAGHTWTQWAQLRRHNAAEFADWHGVSMKLGYSSLAVPLLTTRRQHRAYIVIFRALPSWKLFELF